MLRTIYLTFALLVVPLSVTALSAENAYAQKAEVYTSIRNNFGAGGYDVVSFHKGSPVKGDMKHLAEYKRAQWRFATEANLASFLEEPEKYAPAYGGYCAWAIANNKLAKGSPKHWSIVDGVLYLNFNKRIKNKWLDDTEGFIEKGNAVWPEILEN
ncbi:MAG: YHS domain-containing protein [Acidimicrobiales bacterium]|nr:YHS domain-containing protein [Hyphomonadaceae bacterium]RZV44391.1 MAG: YHS domain-containing protein [Acidimicrobiales bacterium]